ncbi:hypothetical protein HMPREF9336_01036 [Segniliparus rugosus ATCC BAA-974]|uniref:AB hydrolase-1 domain-containing protein n=2 Tax=Segniliparus rugosus TaxID=286804 RepID=E5XNK7_SEGRC|nr:hypothetical protein HMPREF9336_01036 [Segniliparus rugosus ATCC BAA-974]
MAHGLGGVKEVRLDAFAERFRSAGYSCLVFDYRHFGESGGEPRELLDVRLQQEDWRSAVAFARSRDGFSADRVVLWGTSFAGGHVIVTAADDPKVVAVIAQCPFTDGPASALALNPRDSIRLAPQVLRDLVAMWRRRPPVRVQIDGLPGQLALLTARDTKPGYEMLLAASGISDLPRRVPARAVPQIMRYIPGRRAKDVRCPILFCVCAHDSVAPAQASVRHARKAPLGEVKIYDAGHFDIYLGEHFERVVGDQIAFLNTHVRTRLGTHH